MRKELIVFVNTLEKGEEVSVSSVASNRKFVILTSPTGQKFTASVEELSQALIELNSFNSGDTVTKGNSEEVQAVSEFLDVEYGE